MDNINRLLDFINHPESFSEADVEELLRDSEHGNSMILWWKLVLLSPIMMPVQM